MFLFACIEGEVAVLTAGFLCHRGMMSLGTVILCAFLGTCITEQCFFFVGRKYGVKLLEKYPKLAQKSERIMQFLKKYNAAFIFGSRFIYGIRNFSPIAIGMAGIHPAKFSLFNIPAAIIWSIIVAGAGYLFSDTLEAAKKHMEIVEVVALVLLCIGLIFFWIRKSKKNKVQETPK